MCTMFAFIPQTRWTGSTGLVTTGPFGVLRSSTIDKPKVWHSVEWNNQALFKLLNLAKESVISTMFEDWNLQWQTDLIFWFIVYSI